MGVVVVLVSAAGVGAAGGAGLKRVGGPSGELVMPSSSSTPPAINLYDAQHPAPAIEIQPARSLFDPS